MIETWKDIPKYEGLYQVSNLGNVKSLERPVNDNGGIKIIKERILKKQKHYHGYLYVVLNNKKKYIHRLVAQTFLDNPNNYKEINHKDGNKQNNVYSNLEWCTRSQNVKHSYRLGLLKSRIGKNNNQSKQVLQYNLNGNFIKEWESIKEASRFLKINDSSISACCKHKQNKAGNYIWRYKK